MTKQDVLHAGIGEMVHPDVINGMCMIIDNCGERAFSDLIWNGVFGDVVFAYIHPADEMRSTKHFDIIQKAFINAYV